MAYGLWLTAIMRILGIDPGTATIGYGLIDADGSHNRRITAVEHGVLHTDKETPAGERLRRIYLDVCTLIRQWKPDMLSVESLYFFKNAKTAISVSQAGGVIMLAGTQKKLAITEVTPLQVKMAITGYGNADKKQVQHMVQKLLQLDEVPRPNDAADALGAAICCALQQQKRVGAP